MNREWNYSADQGLAIAMFITLIAMAALVGAFAYILDRWLGVSWQYSLLVLVGIVLAQTAHFEYRQHRQRKKCAVSEKQDPWLHFTVERLSRNAGIRKPTILYRRTEVPNAFASGIFPFNTAVSVTRGLLKILNKEELEAVLGHEIAHIKNRDVALTVIATAFSDLTSYLTEAMLELMAKTHEISMELFSSAGSRNGIIKMLGVSASILCLAGWAYFAIILAILKIFQTASEISHLALSRFREYAADSGGSHITSRPDALASALHKIISHNSRLRDERTMSLTDARYLCISPVVLSASPRYRKSRLMGWAKSLANSVMATHPTAEKRIARLRRMSADMRSHDARR